MHVVFENLVPTYCGLDSYPIIQDLEQKVFIDVIFESSLKQ